MTLKSLLAKTRCDNGACTNTADYAVERADTPVAMHLHLCEGCIRQLYELFGYIVPPAVKRKKGEK